MNEDQLDAILNERMLLIEFLSQKKQLFEFIDWRKTLTPKDIHEISNGTKFTTAVRESC